MLTIHYAIAHMTAFAFTNTDSRLSMFALADEMERKGQPAALYYTAVPVLYTGWKMERAARCLHCSVLPSHSLEGADIFVNDLREAVETVKVSNGSVCEHNKTCLVGKPFTG